MKPTLRKNIRARHFIVSYSPKWFDDETISREIKKLKKAYYAIPIFLGLKQKILPVLTIDFLSTDEPWRTHFDIKNWRIKFGGVRNGLAPYFHELTHFFTYPFPPSHLLRNGLAEYIQMKLGNFYKDMSMVNIVKEGGYIPLAKLSSAFSKFSANQKDIKKNKAVWRLSYYEAGCFVKYLVERCGGMKKFMNFYKIARTIILEDCCRDIYKKSLVQLEWEWRQSILSQGQLDQVRFMKLGLSEFKQEFYRNLHLRYLIAASFISPGDTVIDAACGCGYGSRILAQKAQKVIGYDNDEGAIVFAKKYHNLSNIEYKRANIEKVNFPKCDVFVSISTIEHLRNYKKFIEKMKSITRKYIIFSLVVVPYKDVDPYHKKDFSPDEIIELVEDEKWKVFADLRQKEEKVLGRQITIFYNLSNVFLNNQDPSINYNFEHGQYSFNKFLQ